VVTNTKEINIMREYGSTKEREASVEFTITIHCKSCDSENLRMQNVVCKWDIEAQKWKFTDSPEGYIYLCLDCGDEDADCIEREVVK